jgi:glycosyltransferase involved in cell wall biosynthesis
MNKKIHLLNILPTASIGGAEKYVLSLCRHHNKVRFKIFVGVLLSHGIISEKIANEGYKVKTFNMKNGFDFFKALKLIFFIRKQKIDVVNIHGQNPLGILCTILARPPIIINTDHGTTMSSPVKRKPRVILFNRLLLPYVDHFVAVSKGMEKSLRLREKVSPKKISLIYNGVDVKTISNTLGIKNKLKLAMGIPLNVPIIGTVGRLAPEKEYLILLKSLLILKKKNIEFIAIIIGDGPEKNILRASISKLGLNDQVRLLGWQNNVIKFLDIIDVFIFSSSGEAFSITLLEAMAKAKPIVAFDVEGVNEAVVNKKTGFLVPFGNVEQFAQKIALLLNSPGIGKQMGNLALKRVSNNFDISFTIRTLEDLYEKLLQNN